MQHLGLLLPLWLLGAPLVLAFFELMQTPRTRRDTRVPPQQQPLPPLPTDTPRPRA